MAAGDKITVINARVSVEFPSLLTSMLSPSCCAHHFLVVAADQPNLLQ